MTPAPADVDETPSPEGGRTGDPGERAGVRTRTVVLLGVCVALVAAWILVGQNPSLTLGSSWGPHSEEVTVVDQEGLLDEEWGEGYLTVPGRPDETFELLFSVRNDGWVPVTLLGPAESNFLLRTVSYTKLPDQVRSWPPPLEGRERVTLWPGEEAAALLEVGIDDECTVLSEGTVAGGPLVVEVRSLLLDSRQLLPTDRPVMAAGHAPEGTLPPPECGWPMREVP